MWKFTKGISAKLNELAARYSDKTFAEIRSWQAELVKRPSTPGTERAKRLLAWLWEINNRATKLLPDDRAKSKNARATSDKSASGLSARARPPPDTRGFPAPTNSQGRRAPACKLVVPCERSLSY